MSDNENQFVVEERYAKAFDALCNYLAVSPRSEQECKNKLYDKGYHRNEVDFAIEKAKKYRYINDEEYVKTFVMFNKKRYGAKKIAYKLTAEKGVDKQLVENAILDEIDDEFEFDLAKDFANKYIKQKKIEDKSGAQKVSAYLYQKGFEWTVIGRVVSTLFDV